jgi:hypothetical protein
MNDVYVNYGLFRDGWRVWDDARRYGFLCAGGGRCFSDPLTTITELDRLWVYVPGHGYVGVAYATGPVRRASEFTVNTDDGNRPIMKVLGGPYANDKEDIDDPELCEYFLPVRWAQTVALEMALGGNVEYFSNPNIVCRPQDPRWTRTLELLKKEFPKY